MAGHEVNIQDIGGQPLLDTDLPLSDVIKRSAKPYKYWQVQTHGLAYLLSQKKLWTTAEMRRAIESLPRSAYLKKTYYELWSSAVAAISLQRGIVTQQELDQALGTSAESPVVKFQAGDFVRKPHLRTPGYIFGVVGRLTEDSSGFLEDPDVDAHHWLQGPRQPLYRVSFCQADLWEGYTEHSDDKLEIEIVQPWLEPATEQDLVTQQKTRIKPLFHARNEREQHKHKHEHEHEHDGHGHDHVHEERLQVEQNAVDAEGDDSERSRLITALVKILTDKGLITHEELRGWVESLEGWGRDPLGPRLVARAWHNAAFKARLLHDAHSAATELTPDVRLFKSQGGITETSKDLTGMTLIARENTEDTHHLVVCTLCSCYPVSILGMSPSWYKARSYRARAVREPRAVLQEFGTHLPPHVKVVVLDSNADTRYIVIPKRPSGTEGWTEEQLQSLVTRDSMIGVSLAKQPAVP